MEKKKKKICKGKYERKRRGRKAKKVSSRFWGRKGNVKESKKTPEGGGVDGGFKEKKEPIRK